MEPRTRPPTGPRASHTRAVGPGGAVGPGHGVGLRPGPGPTRPRPGSCLRRGAGLLGAPPTPRRGAQKAWLRFDRFSRSSYTCSPWGGHDPEFLLFVNTMPSTRLQPTPLMSILVTWIRSGSTANSVKTRHVTLWRHSHAQRKARLKKQTSQPRTKIAF